MLKIRELVCFLFFLQKSRAALSLLGYCYYQMQDFVNSSDCYEQLSILHPEVSFITLNSTILKHDVFNNKISSSTGRRI